MLDQLVNNRWKRWQDELEQNVSSRFHRRYYDFMKIIGYKDGDDFKLVIPRYSQMMGLNYKQIPNEYSRYCDDYHCCHASLQYHKYLQPITYHQTLQSFNNPGSVRFKEHIWYNIKNNNSFRITGDFEIKLSPTTKIVRFDNGSSITDNDTPLLTQFGGVILNPDIHMHRHIEYNKYNQLYDEIYIPKTSLFLNEVPMLYIRKSYKTVFATTCVKLYFIFDIKTYSNVITVFTKHPKFFKNTYFKYLPKELIPLILYYL